MLNIGESSIQLFNNLSRKGYETDAPVGLAVKMVVISAIILYLFYKLASFRGIIRC